MTTIRTKGSRVLPNPFMGSNAFLQKLRETPTLADKRSQIVEANPLFYIFGIKLDPRNPYERNE